MAAPDLSDLDLFAAVAKERSFRRAAALRGVSASSLSEAVRRLEARLDMRLLNRTTRSVTPTEAGQRLLDRLLPALGDIAGALDAVNSLRGSPTGTLRLDVPTVVAREILPSIATRFLAEHPGVRLDVVANDSFIDVLAAGFDAGVRYDESLAGDMIAVPIGPRVQKFVTAAAPSYLAARGAPRHPRDLLAHACIRHRFASGVVAAWEFEKQGEVLRIRPDGPLTASGIDLELAAAVAGLGVILASGALQPILVDWEQSFTGPFLYYPSRSHMPGPLRAFVDFLKRQP